MTHTTIFKYITFRSDKYDLWLYYSNIRAMKLYLFNELN